MLVEMKELFIKDKDKQKYRKNEQFEQLIINEHFLIQNSHIFYLHATNPYDDGLLDVEELLKQQLDGQEPKYRTFIQGPNHEK